MKLVNFCLDLIFPKRCICGMWDTVLCPNCIKKIACNKTQTCPICKKISKNGKVCSTCRPKTTLTGVMIFGEHEGILKKLIWRYKYEFIRDLSEPLASLVCTKFGSFLSSKRFLITFVPISKRRLRFRGYNQSELLARDIAAKLNLAEKALLKRTGRGKPQVGLTRAERIRNLKNQIQAFDTDISNKKVLVVDDVYTSGTTLDECAKVLREKGYKEIWGLVLSRD